MRAHVEHLVALRAQEGRYLFLQVKARVVGSDGDSQRTLLPGRYSDSQRPQV